DRHRAAYADAAMGFAVGNSGPSEVHPAARAVFAEQRMAAAVARTLGVDLRPVTDRFWLSGESRWDGPDHAALWHHTWHLKNELRTLPELLPAYLRYLLEDLLWRFPEAAGILRAMPGLAEHTDLVAHTLADLEAHGPTTLGALR
ncbi:MAG TPA: hypothetical protein VD813_06645, partial [Pseudonocardia sp.]|nr:hypothetical protein [Pseudonocardia sp.]